MDPSNFSMWNCGLGLALEKTHEDSDLISRTLSLPGESTHHLPRTVKVDVGAGSFSRVRPRDDRPSDPVRTSATSGALRVLDPP